MDVAGASNVLASVARERLDAQLKLQVSADDVRTDDRDDGERGRGKLRLRARGATDLTALSRDNRPAKEAENRQPPPSEDRPAEAAQVSYQRRERTVLRIRTQEGDIVRLKFSNRQNTEIQASSSSQDDQIINELSLTSSSRSRLQISVRGELSDSELGAISDVLNQAGSLADQFFGGNLQSAFDAAAAFQIDGQELARVSLKLGVRERLALAQSVVSAPATQPAAAIAADPAASGETDGLQVTDAALTRQPAPALVQTQTVRNDVPNPTIPAAAPAAGAEAGAVADAEVEDAPGNSGPGFLDAIQALAELLNGVAAFLESLVATLQAGPAQDSEAPPTQSTQIRFDLSFKLKVFQAVVSSFVENAAPDENTDGLNLLGDTVEAIDAETQPPLDTQA